MREHLANAGWGVLDYIAYPMGMLMVAPIVLRRMGEAQYGVWTVAAAVVSIGSIIASGFGDANIQQVAHDRGRLNHDRPRQIVRCMITIHLLLGTGLGLLTWILAPDLAARVVPVAGEMRQDCLTSLELASVLLWVRAMESVCISTQRAFLRYGAAVRISLAARMLSLAAVATLAFLTQSVAAMLAASLVINLIATSRQYAKLRNLLGERLLLPSLDVRTLRTLIAFGGFTWLQAISGVVFSQVDRFYVGVASGAIAVASYALCTQIAQPVYGIAASGLHFIFPYLAERQASHSPSELRFAVLTAFAFNLLFVAASSAVLLLCGPAVLRLLAGKQIAAGGSSLLPFIVMGTALLAINVTATYSLYAFGRVRIVTALNVAGGAVMLLLMLHVTPRLGVYGPAYARISYGLISLGLYVPLVGEWKRGHRAPLSHSPADPLWEEI